MPFQRVGQYVLFRSAAIKPLIQLYCLWRRKHDGIEDSQIISGKELRRREPQLCPDTEILTDRTKEMDRKYFVELFSKFDSAYLESLPDEVFFAKRFVMSEEDQALLLKNSSMVHGRRFYRAKVRNALM